MLKKLFEGNLNASQLYRYQANMLYNVCTSQQYVIGNIQDNQLYLLVDTYPDQLYPITNTTVKFRVFVLKDIYDLQALTSIWNRDSKKSDSSLRLYSLRDLGLDTLSEDTSTIVYYKDSTPDEEYIYENLDNESDYYDFRAT